MHDDATEHIHLGDGEDQAIFLGERLRLLSVGIDIGSSTSHLLFSELLLERQGRHLSSRYVVTRREVRFRSPVILTPYISPQRIDTEALAAFIDKAYQEAGIERSAIDTGAVIITGEAARKENAAPILQLFAQEAGKFVCATAGPNLESLLAAHGSGAVTLSQQPEHPTVLNVDIGGGTTKFAICRNGRVEATAALHVGARLVAWDDRGRLVRVEEAGRRFAREAGFEAQVGAAVQERALDTMADRMAELVVRVIAGEGLPPGSEALWITDPLPDVGPFSHLVFSGGVGEYVYGFETREFGDLGPRLGQALLRRCRDRVLLEPTERIRATCIGASQYTVQVSGNTIFLSPPDVLPVRNIPVVALPHLKELSAAAVADAVQRSLRSMDLVEGEDRFALAVHWHHGPSYDRLRELCAGLAAALPRTIAGRHPLFLVIDADVAGLVGQILREELGVSGPIVCIDQVTLRQFDFIDIGSAISIQQVVPVVVKSLVFR